MPVTDTPQLRALAEAWRRKWDGRWQYEPAADGFHTALVYAVAPTKVLAFGKGTFSHTRHRF